MIIFGIYKGENIMTCPVCKKEVADGTNFCPACGTSMEQGANYSGDIGANSANYANDNNSPAQSGDFRGVREQYANETVYNPNTHMHKEPACVISGEKKSKTWIWVTAIVTAFVLAVLAVCYFVFWKDDDETVSKTSASDNASKDTNEDKEDDAKEAIKDKEDEDSDKEDEDTYKDDKDKDGDKDKNPGNDTQSNGVLTMATNAGYEPFEYYEGSEIVGADVELAEAIAKELGMELEIENMNFEAVFESVSDGEYDIGISGIVPTDEREAFVDFSDSYYELSLVAVVPEDSDIESVYDLEGKTVSYETGSISEYIIGSEYEGLGYDSPTDAFIAVAEGYADACVIDYSTAQDLCMLYDKMLILDEFFYEEEYAIAIEKGNDELAEKINDAIRNLKKDGTLKEIFEKYDLPYEE